MGDPRPWSELREATTWAEDVDGWVYRLREPSVVRLMGKGVSLPVVEVKNGREVFRTAGGAEKTFYLNEKEQEIVLRDCVVEPVLHNGSGEPKEGSVTLADLGSHADVLVVAIIKRIYGGALVRAASFRGGEQEGAVDSADGKGGVDVPGGSAEASAV